MRIRIVALALAGCTRPAPQCPVHDDSQLRAELAATAAKLAASEAELASLQTATAPVPVPVPPIEPTTPASASKEFLGLVTGARPGIHTCHRAAIASDPALAGTPIQLAITASFAVDGSITKFATSPAVSATFDACVAALSTRWRLALTSPMAFKAQVTLTP